MEFRMWHVTASMAFVLFLFNLFSIVQHVHQPTSSRQLSSQFEATIHNNGGDVSMMYLYWPMPSTTTRAKLTSTPSSTVVTVPEQVIIKKKRNTKGHDVPSPTAPSPPLKSQVKLESKGKNTKGHDMDIASITPPLKSPMKFESNLVEEDPPNFHVTKKEKNSKGCHVRYPPNKEVKFNNRHWQVLDMVGWKMYYYSAFYDNRDATLKPPDIRIIGITDSLQVKNKTLFCQVWFSEYETAKVIRVSRVHILWPWKKGVTNRYSVPFMLSCPLKGELKDLVPFAVSVVAEKCTTATNKLKMINPQSPQKPPSDFGVCVKGLDFPDIDTSLRLIEWIELLRLLGATKIQLYLYAVHPNAKKVLEYYEREGLVEVGPLTIPGPFSNDPLRRHQLLTRNIAQKRYLELLPMNDCLYRNLRFKYLAFLDVDEVILPLKVRTWKKLLRDQLEKEAKVRNESVTVRPKSKRAAVSSYQVKQNGCFFHGIKRPWFDEIPKSMHMLSHIYKIPPKENAKFYIGMKAFFVSDRVLGAFNHRPFICLNGPCRIVKLNETLAQLNHYKHIHRHCNGPEKMSENYSCNNLQCLNNTVEDKTIWRYKKPLAKRFSEAVANVFKDQPPTQWTE